jgi:hypothetical protein
MCILIKGRRLNKSCDSIEADNDMVWQINSSQIAGTLNTWK